MNAYQKFEIKSLRVNALYTVSRRKFPADYSFVGETHDFYEIVYVAGGRAGITAEREVFVLSEGQLVIHPPNEFHRIWSDGEAAEIIIFSFDADFPPPHAHLFSLGYSQREKLLALYQEAEAALLFRGVQIAGIRDEARAMVLIKELEIFLIQLLSGRAEAPILRPAAENFQRIVAVMERGPHPMSLSEIASEAHMSVSALEKTVRKYAGCGARAHYNNLRMQRAAKLLKSGASVKETALSTGFSNQNYFSLAFTKWAGVSPSRYGK